jgi:hypothetical protein
MPGNRNNQGLTHLFLVSQESRSSITDMEYV